MAISRLRPRSLFQETVCTVGESCNVGVPFTLLELLMKFLKAANGFLQINPLPLTDAVLNTPEKPVVVEHKLSDHIDFHSSFLDLGARLLLS